MLEKSSQLRKHLQGNPLGLHLAPFAASLKEDGYTGGTVQWKLVSLAGFGRWLRKTGRGVTHLDEPCLDAFLKQKRACTAASQKRSSSFSIICASVA
jgi:hypothetical protein